MSFSLMPGANCRAVREAKGQTQAQAAKAIGISRVAYCQMENGKRKVAALELAALCEFWKVPYKTLFVSF